MHSRYPYGVALIFTSLAGVFLAVCVVANLWSHGPAVALLGGTAVILVLMLVAGLYYMDGRDHPSTYIAPGRYRVAAILHRTNEDVTIAVRLSDDDTGDTWYRIYALPDKGFVGTVAGDTLDVTAGDGYRRYEMTTNSGW